MASSKCDLEEFVNLSLFHQQNGEIFAYFKENDDEVKALLKSKKKWRRKEKSDDEDIEKDPIKNSINFLVDYEFIRYQLNEETDELKFVPTSLGRACLCE